MAAYFQRFDEAESLYREIDRKAGVFGSNVLGAGAVGYIFKCLMYIFFLGSVQLIEVFCSSLRMMATTV